MSWDAYDPPRRRAAWAWPLIACMVWSMVGYLLGAKVWRPRLDPSGHVLAHCLSEDGK